MSISQHLKSSLLSFSGKRVGYVLSAVSFGLTPAHFMFLVRPAAPSLDKRIPYGSPGGNHIR